MDVRRPPSDARAALELAARAGYLAKGVVYVLVGGLSLDGAFDGRAGAEGSRGALREMTAAPYGQLALGLLGVGLLGYALWRLYAAAVDAEGRGSQTKGIAVRAGMAVTGLVHGSLAVYAFSLLARRGGDEPLVAAGATLTMLAGVVVAGVGLYEIVRAATDAYERNWRTGEMSATERTWGRRFAKAGLLARGVVFAILGMLFVTNGATSSEAGLGAALSMLSRQVYGSILLGLVATGLVAYGLYCGVEARYRAVRT